MPRQRESLCTRRNHLVSRPNHGVAILNLTWLEALEGVTPRGFHVLGSMFFRTDRTGSPPQLCRIIDRYDISRDMVVSGLLLVIVVVV